MHSCIVFIYKRVWGSNRVREKNATQSTHHRLSYDRVIVMYGAIAMYVMSYITIVMYESAEMFWRLGCPKNIKDVSRVTSGDNV